MRLVISGEDAPDGGLPGALREAERRVAEHEPEVVVLEDDSDFALAAALVAAKLLVPIEPRPGAIDPSTTNARLIAQIAPSYTPPG